MTTVLRIEHLYKEYRLGVIGHGTLYHDLQSWWANIRGKEDPNSLIGSRGNGRVKDHILALKDINLEVHDGEVLGIIGANGAGKSTLLKILSKVTSPTKGSIKYKGRIASLLEVGTGFHSELTGRENIYLNGAINGMTRQEVSKKLDDIVEFAGVTQFLDTPVKRYSSGMYVRLGFAVAAYLEPDILVVDEVLAVGDAAFQKKAISKMQEVSTAEGRTVLFVSHNMTSIEKLCQSAIMIEKGMIKYSGPARETIDFYINQEENSGPTPYSELASRHEKHKILKSIKLVNKDNVQTGTFKMGEKIIFELELDPGDEVLNSPRILIDIGGRRHGAICYFSSDQMVNTPFTVRNKTVVRCIWDGCYLIHGVYFVGVKLTAIASEFANSILKFEILENDIYGTGREVAGNPDTVFIPHGYWQFE